ncbi:MAG: DUF2341 domain-containing protein [Chitinophagaceae bacterium]|nr:DUF2341 domain-containing protein [Chitinophagaceae bacterium]
MVINTQALITGGQLDPTGKDLRFGTDNGATLFNYWIESGLNTTSTVVWVKINSLLALQPLGSHMYQADASDVSVVELLWLIHRRSLKAARYNPGVVILQRGFRFAPIPRTLHNRPW